MRYAAFQRLRAILADDPGLEPSPELRALEDAILLQKPELDWQPPVMTLPGPTGPERSDRAGPIPPEPILDQTEAPLPGGGGPTVSRQVVTFLFTDMEASTSLWERHPSTMAAVLARHDHLIGDAIAGCGGLVFKTVGDAVHAVFASPVSAVRAALAVQAAIVEGEWPEIGRLAVRVGIYTGEAEFDNGEWRGRALNRCARLRDAASGGQILASHATVDLLGDDLADQVVITSLGAQQLRGVPRAEQVHQVQACRRPVEPAGATESSAPRSDPLDAIPAPLIRAARQTLIGREAELARLRQHLSDPDNAGGVSLIAGEAGVGKTRLAAAAATMAAENGTVVLYGRCDEGLSVPYQPFAEALGFYVSKAQPQKLALQLGSSGHELGRVLPGLAERVVGLRPPPAPNPRPSAGCSSEPPLNF